MSIVFLRNFFSLFFEIRAFCSYIGANIFYHHAMIMSRGCAEIGAKNKMNAVIQKKVGQNIRRLRKAQGMTQEILAAKLQLRGCDITRSAVAKIEVGARHLYPDEIIALREILRVSYEEIFDISDI